MRLRPSTVLLHLLLSCPSIPDTCSTTAYTRACLYAVLRVARYGLQSSTASWIDMRFALCPMTHFPICTKELSLRCRPRNASQCSSTAPSSHPKRHAVIIILYTPPRPSPLLTTASSSVPSSLLYHAIQVSIIPIPQTIKLVNLPVLLFFFFGAPFPLLFAICKCSNRSSSKSSYSSYPGYSLFRSTNVATRRG